MKGNTFILKYFLQFACTNLDGSQKEGGNFLNLLQKEGALRKEGFSPQNRGVPTLEETMNNISDHQKASSNGHHDCQYPDATTTFNKNNNNLCNF